MEHWPECFWSAARQVTRQSITGSPRQFEGGVGGKRYQDLHMYICSCSRAGKPGNGATLIQHQAFFFQEIEISDFLLTSH